MYTTEAWVLRPGELRQPAELEREVISFGALEDDEVLLEPLYGCWEGNMTHAVQRDPVDVCRRRGEERVVIGNAGVQRVLAVGRDVTSLAEGDVCIGYFSYQNDPHGYMLAAPGFDIPGSIGFLAKRTKALARAFVRVPTGTPFPIEQWAAWSLRYPTAWSNWQLARGCHRLQMPELPDSALHVWGWGGGTTLAELDLARRMGAQTVMISGDPERLAEIAALGIGTVDRRLLADLHYDDARYRNDADYRARYERSEAELCRIVDERTDRAGVSIFIDQIGTPVHRASLRALGRQGVLATSGWKKGMTVSSNRALECWKRHVHVHTHYARDSEILPALQYSIATGWMPPIPRRIYGWDEIPQLARDAASDRTASNFAIYQVSS